MHTCLFALVHVLSVTLIMAAMNVTFIIPSGILSSALPARGEGLRRVKWQNWLSTTLLRNHSMDRNSRQAVPGRKKEEEQNQEEVRAISAILG